MSLPTRGDSPPDRTIAALAEEIRVELVCAMRRPDARGGREPDLGAAHRAACAILAATSRKEAS